MDEALEYGMSVRVIKQSKYKTTKLLGKIGTVRSSYPGSGSIPVEFDNEFNAASSYGYYYFKRNDLEIVDTNTDTEEKIMGIITNYFNIVKVQYLSDSKASSYNYANFNPDIKVDDVVITKRGPGDYGLAKVVEILDTTDVKTDREVVTVVDMSAYNERVANRAKAAELKAKMEERAKQLQDIALYQLLAKDDSAMMDLLKEYQSVVNM